MTEMLLTEHLNASPGGRPNELVEMAEHKCRCDSAWKKDPV